MGQPGKMFNLNSFTTMTPGVLGAQLIAGNIKKGNNRGQRHGDKILLTGVRIRGAIRARSDLKADAGRCRIIVGTSKRVGEVPTINLWEGAVDENAPDNFFTTGDKTEQLFRPININKWIIHYDKVHDCGLIGTGECKSKLKMIDIWISMKNRINYDVEEDVSITHGVTPNMWLLYFFECDDGHNCGAAWAPAFSYFLSTYFRDI